MWTGLRPTVLRSAASSLTFLYGMYALFCAVVPLRTLPITFQLIFFFFFFYVILARKQSSFKKAASVSSQVALPGTRISVLNGHPIVSSGLHEVDGLPLLLLLLHLVDYLLFH